MKSLHLSSHSCSTSGIVSNPGALFEIPTDSVHYRWTSSGASCHGRIKNQCISLLVVVVGNCPHLICHPHPRCHCLHHCNMIWIYLCRNCHLRYNHPWYMVQRHCWIVQGEFIISSILLRHDGKCILNLRSDVHHSVQRGHWVAEAASDLAALAASSWLLISIIVSTPSIALVRPRHGQAAWQYYRSW